MSNRLEINNNGIKPVICPFNREINVELYTISTFEYGSTTQKW